MARVTQRDTVERIFRSDRGVATSMIEAVVVLAISAILAYAALLSAMDNIEDARVSRAITDTQEIGIAIHSFMRDTGFAPAFTAGDARTPDDPVFLVLETAGSNPTADEALHWPTDLQDRDSLENQLIKNRPGNSAIPYPRVGEISWARYKGWNGPYVAKMPSSDPWDDKYLVNIQMMTPQGIEMADSTLTMEVGQRAAVFVISAGPNRVLETRFDQVADSFAPAGDDIIFRIQ